MEATGLVVGIAGLAGVFTSCVDCLEYVRLGREFGNDYSTCILRLDVAQIRLERWGHAVGLAQGSPDRSRIDATDEEVEIAKRLLERIEEIFRKTQETSREYGPSMGTSREVELHNRDTPLESRVQRLSLKLHTSAASYKKKSALVTRAAAWGIFRKKTFDQMVQDITVLIDQLVGVFPQTITDQKLLAAEEVLQIEDTEDLKLLGEISRSEDEFLEKAAKQEVNLRGSTYNRLEGRGRSRLHVGDIMENRVQGRSHTYNGGGTFDEADGHFGNVYRG